MGIGCLVPVAMGYSSTEGQGAPAGSFEAASVHSQGAKFLCDNFGADSSANGAATFPNSEVDPFFHRHRLDQLHRHFDVVARNDHLHPFGQLDSSRHIGGAHIKLRTIAIEE